jgi:hypothetical protein
VLIVTPPVVGNVDQQSSTSTMGEEMKEWSHMWGAKVKLRNDMPDDMLRDAIETSRRILGGISDFDTEGYTARMTLI